MTKLLSWPEAKQKAQEVRATGSRLIGADGTDHFCFGKVVFTNGCFDLFHAGHVHVLEGARREGDYLIVGLNTDHSVRLNKGTGRPIIPMEQRARLLAALTCVDAIVPFDGETPEFLIEFLCPDIIVKGGDYDPDTIAGSAFVRARGGKVVIVPSLPELSSSKIMQTVYEVALQRNRVL